MITSIDVTIEYHDGTTWHIAPDPQFAKYELYAIRIKYDPGFISIYNPGTHEHTLIPTENVKHVKAKPFIEEAFDPPPSNHRSYMVLG